MAEALRTVSTAMEQKSTLPEARSVVMRVLVKSSITVEEPVEAGVISISVAMLLLGLGLSLKEDSLEKGVGGLLEGSL